MVSTIRSKQDPTNCCETSCAQRHTFEDLVCKAREAHVWCTRGSTRCCVCFGLCLQHPREARSSATLTTKLLNLERCVKQATSLMLQKYSKIPSLPFVRIRGPSFGQRGYHRSQARLSLGAAPGAACTEGPTELHGSALPATRKQGEKTRPMIQRVLIIY